MRKNYLLLWKPYLMNIPVDVANLHSKIHYTEIISNRHEDVYCSIVYTSKNWNKQKWPTIRERLCGIFMSRILFLPSYVIYLLPWKCASIVLIHYQKKKKNLQNLMRSRISSLLLKRYKIYILSGDLALK